MKIKNSITLLLVAIILASCSSAVKVVSMEAVVSTSIFTPISTVTSVSTTCSDLNLTPEEKINCGTQTYQIETTLAPACPMMRVKDGINDVITVFSGNIMTASFHEWEFKKIAANVYVHVRGKLDPASNINRHINTITFTMNGFAENYAYEDYAGRPFDCWLDTYTIVK